MSIALAEEAKRYFHEHPVLLNLAMKFCQKYRSLGHFGGIAVLSQMSVAEQEHLSAFLRREASCSEHISYREFSSAWHKTRFDSLSLEDFLISLMPNDFITKKEERARELRQRQSIHETLIDRHPNSYAATWLDALHSKELRLPQKELYLQEDILERVAQALEQLPEKYERLPLFANRTLGNPHALDHNQIEGRLFLQALAFLKGESIPSDADERTRLMYQFHILRDDILNFATVYGLTARKSDRTEIPYWQESVKTHSPLNIPLREIVRAAEILPATDTSCPVFIVENSGVFSALIDLLQSHRKIVPLLALHGQLKAASWALLDKLEKTGVRFLYAGDYDPEGLTIADKLLSRYPNAETWHMSPEKYCHATIHLPESRIKKLPANIHPQLEQLAHEMRVHKRILYQESLIDSLANDILRV